MNKGNPKLVGIDLAGSPGRPTGLCILVGKRAAVSVVFSDEEILQAVGTGAQAIAIDAPLSLPRGRCCLRDDCSCAGKAHFRVCDLELRRMGIKFFPITLGPMRVLTVRGILLKKRFEEMSCRVFETYPGAAQDIWGIPRQKDPDGLREGLMRFKLGGNWRNAGVSKHELDALTCALIAKEDLKGNAMKIGDPEEGLMILPKGVPGLRQKK